MVDRARGLLIFNADDYGLTPGVSEGILEAARGVVRSTSVMGNLVTESEAALLREAIASGKLHAAAHLNLSCGLPLCRDYPARLLNADGGMDKQRALAAYTWDAAELRSAALVEWRAQIARIREFGITLTHLDSHHHTHLLPPLFDAALDLACELGLGLRVRADQRSAARARGVAAPDCFVEGYFGRDRISSGSLLKLLDAAPPGSVEVMCHPGKNDVALGAISGYTSERQAEMAVLGSRPLLEAIWERDWSIGSYADLPGG